MHPKHLIILLGDIDKTEKLLNEAFMREVASTSIGVKSLEDWKIKYKKIRGKYSRAFKKINRSVPDFDKYEDYFNK